jgi:hypothetical protein
MPLLPLRSEKRDGVLLVAGPDPNQVESSWPLCAGYRWLGPSFGHANVKASHQLPPLSVGVAAQAGLLSVIYAEVRSGRCPSERSSL